MEPQDRIHGIAERPVAAGRSAVPEPDDDTAASPRMSASAAQTIEPLRRGFSARLNYDPVEADVFIEILDPQTGEVIRRLPAESPSDDSANSEIGTLVDRIA